MTYKLNTEEINKIKKRANKTFFNYPVWFKNDAIDVDDINQELLLRALETINKYQKKSDEEIIKLIHHGISWKIFDLIRDAKFTSNKFNIVENNEVTKENVIEMFPDVKNKKDLFIKIVYPYCTLEEIVLLEEKLIDGYTFEALGEVYGLTKQKMHRKYHKIIKKLKGIHNK